MPETSSVATHYTHGDLLAAITAGLAKLGKTLDTVLLEDLAPIDEFHIGGRAATESFLDPLGIEAGDQVLDVGCGLGGASRFAAHRYGCRVTGIDLTDEFVQTGKVLSSWVGLADRVVLEQGDASATGYAEGMFDKAFMLHVGMNIADKSALALELHRILKPGGTLGIYDIMYLGDGELAYPVPWATSADRSDIGSPADYREALKAAGFRITVERNRREFALDFFAGLQASASLAGGPPPLGLHILFGETAPTQIQNMVRNITENRITPIELIAKKLL
ncbi:MAG: methyltransferase domain-containing protein [Gemmatimonadota bacterium]